MLTRWGDAVALADDLEGIPAGLKASPRTAVVIGIEQPKMTADTIALDAPARVNLSIGPELQAAEGLYRKIE